MKYILKLFKVVKCPSCKSIVSDKTGKCPKCSSMFGKDLPLATGKEMMEDQIKNSIN